MSAVLRLATLRVTDSQRIDWLCKRVSYLEHASATGVPAVKATKGGYWPQSDEDSGGAQVEELCRLDLVEYIDAMIALEMKGEAA